MRPVVHCGYLPHRQLRVALRRRKSLVAEQLLDRAQIGAFFQHVRPKSMPQRVRMNIGRQSMSQRNMLHNPPNAPRGQPAIAAQPQI
jgi:hypothetical protein